MSMMDTQTQAQIYLADQRGRSQVDYLRSMHCFNFGQYVAEGRQPFGALQLLNDDVLKPGHGVRMGIEANTEVLILPLVGGLEYESSVGNGFLEAGQVLRFSLIKGMSYEIINPYETEFINYLAIWLTNPSLHFAPGLTQTPFDLQRKNTLIPLFNPTQDAPIDSVVRGFVGRYDGRAEDVYQLDSAGDPSSRGVFVFVLSGAFEVQNRLLHERDGLALASIQEDIVDFEALSNGALLLLLDIPLTY